MLGNGCGTHTEASTLCLNIYRPATKLGQGYVFTCVCDSVHRGVSQHALQVVSRHALQQVSGGGMVSQHALQVSRPTPKGEVEVSGQGGLLAHTWGGGACRGGCLLRGVCGEPPPRHRDSYCCRRYTSYWIAFLYNCESMISINADADARCEYALRDRINE